MGNDHISGGDTRRYMNLAVLEKAHQMLPIKVHNISRGPVPEQTNRRRGGLESVLYLAKDWDTGAMDSEPPEFIEMGGVAEQPVGLSRLQKSEASKKRRAHPETVGEPPDEFNPVRCVDESWPGRIPPS